MSALNAMKISDPKHFGRVGLLVGGDSAERDVSLHGGKAVLAALQRNHIDSKIFDGSAALFAAINSGQIDRVFNLMHGPGGEDGAIQGALQLMNIPITGSGLLGSALSMDKVRSKWVWERLGIRTPQFTLLWQGEEPTDDLIEQLSWPLFVKPAGLGSSIGITRLEQVTGLAAAIARARQYGETVIIEPEVNGEEYFAGVVGDQVLPLIRVTTPRSFYDYTAKYESHDTQYFCPCGLPEEIEKMAQERALEAFKVLHCCGWGRVDFILDEAGRACFLEVNTAPGMTSHSLVPQAAAQIGIAFDELVWRILESSL